jgi:beta-galactosidase
LTQYILASPQKNVIAVKVDNSLQPDSRWYSGSGIYRSVKLILTGKIFVETGGIFITALPKRNDTAEMQITTVLTTSFKTDQKITLVNTIYDKSGKLVTRKGPFEFVTYFEGSAIVQKVKIPKPALWSTVKPDLYILKTQLFKSGELTDEINTSFGIRYFEFNSENGFALNGKS